MERVAKALIYDPKGNILVIQRSDTHPRFPLHPDFPGGIIELGEDPAVGVVREIQEESGLLLDHKSLHLVDTHQSTSGSTYMVYIAKLEVSPPPVALSWEHSTAAWIAPEELLAIPLPEGVDEYYITALRYLRSTQS